MPDPVIVVMPARQPVVVSMQAIPLPPPDGIGQVVLSPDPGNILETRANGLYAAP